jgi:predicted dehydrogenase
MGKRRVRNLQRLGVGTIVGFDLRKDRRTEAAERYGIAAVDSLEKAFAVAPDAVVICTPPDTHVTYAREAVRHRLPFFTEASVIDADMELLIDEVDTAGVVAAPSCTMRFQPSVQAIKSAVDTGALGQLVAFTYHSGQYLPDWHPWEDYRSFYAGKRLTGACREIVPFELCWITWALGPVITVEAFRGKVGDLDVDIDDVYQVLVRLRSGVLGHILVEVISRTPVRRLNLVGMDQTLVWDWAERAVRMFDPKSGAWSDLIEATGTIEPGYVHAEEPYVDEMATFLRAVSGEATWPYSLREDAEMLRLLAAVERSSDTGRRVSVSP